MYPGLHVKNPLFLFCFSETWIFSKDFQKNIQISNFVKIHLVGAEFFYANRQTDMANLFAIFRKRLKRWVYCTIDRSCWNCRNDKTNSLSFLKEKQTTAELTTLIFMLNLCSTTGRPSLRNSFLLVYELRTVIWISSSMSYYCVFPLKLFPCITRSEIACNTYIYIYFIFLFEICKTKPVCCYWYSL